MIKRFDAVAGANFRLALHRLRQFSGLMPHAKAPMRQCAKRWRHLTRAKRNSNSDMCLRRKSYPLALGALAPWREQFFSLDSWQDLAGFRWTP